MTQSPNTFESILHISAELGLRLEKAHGIGTWEAQPVIKHQKALKRIMASIRVEASPESDCGCVWYPDVEVRFPDGSFKRPDIAVWCREPDEEEEAVTLIPEAVIEIISRGFEKKDTEIGAPFYLSMGVKDVILLDPYSGRVEHRRSDGAAALQSPANIRLECGCECVV